ncbi:MAG: hypothetical protein ACRDQF_16120 [Thermocrispum sp.]
MLYIVLILVLAALGLLVAALVTSTSLYAWISIALSVGAAVALFVDWLNRRRAERRATTEPAELAETPEAVETPEAAEPAEAAEQEPAEEEPAEEEQPTAVVAAVAAEEPEDDEPAGAVPGEEETDAADLLIVCELEDQVIVVDEHPRYHLAECRWLSEKDTIPIAVAEARELGFTPCVRCRPDEKLAARARRKRVAGAS